MLLIIKNNSQLNLSVPDVMLTARKRIALYPSAYNEHVLDNYLLKHYKTNLKLMCLKLLSKAVYLTDSATGDIIVKFTDKKYDTIASLITYGDGIIQGSNIWRNAFKW